MKHPNQLLPQHIQKHERSCIAWSLELVLKMHGKLDVSGYPLQDGSDPCGYGFGDRERQILKQKGIDSKEHNLDWKEFADLSCREVERGSFPVFALPLFKFVDLERMEVGTGWHAFVVCDNPSGQLIALTMSLKPPKLIPVEHPEKLFRMCRLIEPNCTVHVLSHG
jgi:hypothetical protein